MIRWKIPALLTARGWTPYRLSREAGLTIPAAYRLAKGGAIQRIDAATLEKLCDVFDAEPGDLLQRVVSSGRKRRK